MEWFRFYHDFCANLKVRRLSWDQRGVIIAAWCIASRSPVRGSLLITDGVPAVADDLADEAKLSPQFVAAAIGTPEQPGYLCPAWFTWQRGVLIAHDWDARQFRSDDVTERTRRHKQKPAGTPRERSGERSGEHPRNVPGNTQGTPPDTDTDTDTDTETETETDTETETETENKRAAANRTPARANKLNKPAASVIAATQLAAAVPKSDSAAASVIAATQLAAAVPKSDSAAASVIAATQSVGPKEFPWWGVFERTFGLTRVPESDAEILRQWSREGMESAVIEQGFRLAIQAKARLPAKWTVSTLAPLYAAGVRTMEQAQIYWQERQAAEEERRNGRLGHGKPGTADGSGDKYHGIG